MTSTTARLTVHPVPSMGAEDVLVLPGGDVVTGTEDGSIWRVSPDGGRVDQVARTGGRPLGLELFDDGRLLVCVARRGLLRVRMDTGAVDPLVDRVDGVPMRFCNNAAIGADGTIWFSDSSLHYDLDHWKDDFAQHTRSGRLLRRDPAGGTTVVLEGLAFANGVALAADGSFVCVAQTRGRSVVRLWLTGPRAGERDHLARDLPGYPDNISLGSDGLVWVSIASPLDPLVERIGRSPMALRKAVTRIPERLQPQPRRTIRVQAYDDAGTLVRDVDVQHAGFHMVTGVRKHEGRIWLGSLHESAIAVIDQA